MESGFYDLCINNTINNTKSIEETLNEVIQLGFRTVAINTDVDESVFVTEKRKKKREDSESQNVIPEPNLEDLKKRFEGKLTIFSRITFHCSDPIKTHTLGHNMILKKYDLYAFVPKSQNALQFACTQLNTDIICLKPTTSNLKLNKKIYEQAIERGVHFEIQYSDLLNNETRKTTFYYSHLFYTYGKSKNVIVSSGAHNKMQLRNPYDIVNLGGFLGLSNIKAKNAILWQCKSLLLRAERRRKGKGLFSIEYIVESTDESDVKKIKLSPNKLTID